MTTENGNIVAIAAAVRRRATSAHQALAEVDGCDPEWSRSCAKYAHQAIGRALGIGVAAEALTALLADTDRARGAGSEGAEWSRVYARFLADRAGN